MPWVVVLSWLLTQAAIAQTQNAEADLTTTPTPTPTANSATYTVSALRTQTAEAAETLPTATPGLSQWRLALEQRIID